MYAVYCSFVADWSVVISRRFPLLCQYFLSFCQCDDDDDAFMFGFQIQENLPTRICTSEFALIVRGCVFGLRDKGHSKRQKRSINLPCNRWIYHWIWYKENRATLNQQHMKLKRLKGCNLVNWKQHAICHELPFHCVIFPFFLYV